MHGYNAKILYCMQCIKIYYYIITVGKNSNSYLAINKNALCIATEMLHDENRNAFSCLIPTSKLSTLFSG